MKCFVKVALLLISVLVFQKSFAQESKYLHHLVDSLPKGKPVFVNFEVEKDFMATERIAISKNGKTIFYGVRNGYGTLGDLDAIAHIMKIEYNKGAWSKPKIVFADSSGAPAFSRDEKTLYFQYDDTLFVKGLYTNRRKTSWAIPKQFKTSIKKISLFTISQNK